MNRSKRPLAQRPTLFVALWCLFALACTVARRASVPANQWREERGPVVPHDSFPADCSLCHEGGTWSVIRDDFAFDHGAETGIMLEGAHATAECLRCHNDRGPVERFARQGCAGCHEDVHRGKLGKSCADCHDQDLWRPRGQIERHAQTRFPLVGAHAATGCFRCHPGAEVGNFDRTPIECLSCHADDLARAVSPDHVANSFVSDCDRCHNPTSWTGAAFNHGTFPLTGAHAVTDCAQCHVGGVYRGTPRDCASCHIGDYNGTTSPNHAAAGFPTTCQSCHDTSDWDGATFMHSFPIAGPHDRSCTECHQVPRNFSVFSCIHCHDHNQVDTDDDHDEVSGYVYSSPACYSCHADGNR